MLRGWVNYIKHEFMPITRCVLYVYFPEIFTCVHAMYGRPFVTDEGLGTRLYRYMCYYGNSPHSTSVSCSGESQLALDKCLLKDTVKPGVCW